MGGEWVAGQGSVLGETQGREPDLLPNASPEAVLVTVSIKSLTPNCTTYHWRVYQNSGKNYISIQTVLLNYCFRA